MLFYFEWQKYEQYVVYIAEGSITSKNILLR